VRQDDIEFEDRVTEVLMVLSDVSSNRFAARLPDLPGGDRFSVLFQAVNETVDSLAEAHTQGERYQTELAQKLAMIEQQRAAIRELSTPVIEVWEGVLCLPIVGVMDTSRSAEITETLLRAITEKQSRCAIIDVTGIEVMDTATADHFLRMAKAVRLLGAQCFLTGISPAIAQTMVHMGVNLLELTTHGTLREGLARIIGPTHGKPVSRTMPAGRAFGIER
jgi:rsbT co-antagonist protein RsbR